MNNSARVRSRSNAHARSALVLGLGLLLAGVLAGGVTAASGPPPFTPAAAESELVRLLNIERTRAGLPILAVDVFLAQRARDGSIPCAGDPTKVMAGRAADLAANWSPYGSVDPHLLRLCPTEHIFGPMYVLWGYTGFAGEIIAWNGGYTMNPMQYPSDCGVEGMTGPCYDITPGMVSVAATGWMEELGHRAIVLGNYDRFGCGAAEAADGSHVFVCDFSMGGGTAIPDPSPSPTPSPSASPDPSPSPDPSASPSPSPSPGAQRPPADTTPPTVPSRIYSHTGRRIHTGTGFADAIGLSRIWVAVDGRTRASWSILGRRAAARAWTGTLARGRHVIVWRARDLAGNTRTTTLVIRLR